MVESSILRTRIAKATDGKSYVLENKVPQPAASNHPTGEIADRLFDIQDCALPSTIPPATGLPIVMDPLDEFTTLNDDEEGTLDEHSGIERERIQNEIGAIPQNNTRQGDFSSVALAGHVVGAEAAPTRGIKIEDTEPENEMKRSDVDWADLPHAADIDIVKTGSTPDATSQHCPSLAADRSFDDAARDHQNNSINVSTHEVIDLDHYPAVSLSDTAEAENNTSRARCSKRQTVPQHCTSPSLIPPLPPATVATRDQAFVHKHLGSFPMPFTIGGSKVTQEQFDPLQEYGLAPMVAVADLRERSESVVLRTARAQEAIACRQMLHHERPAVSADYHELAPEQRPTRLGARIVQESSAIKPDSEDDDVQFIGQRSKHCLLVRLRLPNHGSSAPIPSIETELASTSPQPDEPASQARSADFVSASHADQDESHHSSSLASISFKLPTYSIDVQPYSRANEEYALKISIPGLVRETVLLSPEYAAQETYLFKHVFLPSQQALAAPDPQPSFATLNFHTISVMVLDAFTQFEYGDLAARAAFIVESSSAARQHMHSSGRHSPENYGGDQLKRCNNARSADVDDIFFEVVDRWRVGLDPAAEKRSYKLVRGVQEFCDVALEIIHHVKEHGMIADKEMLGAKRKERTDKGVKTGARGAVGGGSSNARQGAKRKRDDGGAGAGSKGGPGRPRKSGGVGKVNELQARKKKKLEKTRGTGGESKSGRNKG